MQEYTDLQKYSDNHVSNDVRHATLQKSYMRDKYKDAFTIYSCRRPQRYGSPKLYIAAVCLVLLSYYGYICVISLTHVCIDFPLFSHVFHVFLIVFEQLWVLIKLGAKQLSLGPNKNNGSLYKISFF